MYAYIRIHTYTEFRTYTFRSTYLIMPGGAEVGTFTTKQSKTIATPGNDLFFSVGPRPIVRC